VHIISLVTKYLYILYRCYFSQMTQDLLALSKHLFPSSLSHINYGLGLFLWVAWWKPHQMWMRNYLPSLIIWVHLDFLCGLCCSSWVLWVCFNLVNVNLCQLIIFFPRVRLSKSIDDFLSHLGISRRNVPPWSPYIYKNTVQQLLLLVSSVWFGSIHFMNNSMKCNVLLE